MIHANINRGLGCLSIILAFGACADETVSLGGGRVSQEIQRGPRCSDSPVISGSVRVTSQTELDELAGCEAIDGDLHVEIFAGADLSPLASLRSVDGLLELGAFPATPEEGVDTAEVDAIDERIEQVVADGYLPSLRGLESLERVASLDIYFIAAEDLSPLLALRELNGPDGSLPDGFVGIHDTNLRTLHGLENVEGIQHLVLSDNLELESLSGIALGPSLVNINLIDSPKLTSIAELAPVTQAFTLYLSNLGVTDLESLQNLAVVESGISLTGNANLVDVERLAGVSTESLIINENPALTSIPALREMWFLESFTVVGNPELQSINIDLPQHGGGPDAIQDSLLVDPIKVIDIGRNDKLTQVSLTAGLEQGRFLAIYANPALERVALGSLTRLESLSVTGNPSLTSLDPGALQTVESLSVIDNPSLDTAPLGAIRTFESTLGNVEEPAAAP